MTLYERLPDENSSGLERDRMEEVEAHVRVIPDLPSSSSLSYQIQVQYVGGNQDHTEGTRLPLKQLFAVCQMLLELDALES